MGGGPGQAAFSSSPSSSATSEHAPPAPPHLLRKAPSVQAPVAPLRGKPRIFAAMEGGADGELEPAPLNPRWSYAQPQQQQQRRQLPQPPPQPYYQQQLRQEQQQPYPAPAPAPAPPAHHVLVHHTMHGHPSAHRQGQGHEPQHEHLQELLPSVEFFATPKTHPDSLPSEAEFENANANAQWGGGFQGDPRASFVARPPSPKRTPSVSEPAPMPTPPMQPHPEVNVLRSKHGRSRSRSRSGGDEPTPAQQSAARARKLSKSRPVHHPDGSSVHSLLNASVNGSATTLPSTPESHTIKIHQHGAHKFIAKVPQHPPTPMSPPPPKQASSLETGLGLGDVAMMSDGIIPLDDDPFARVEGVTMLKPTTPPPPREGSIKRPRAAKEASSSKSQPSENGAEDAVGSAKVEAVEGQLAGPQKANGAAMPLTPVSPEDYRQWRKEHKSSKSTASAVVVPPPVPVIERIEHRDIVPINAPPREALTLTKFVADPQLLASLLAFLTFYDWCVLSSVSKEIRILFVRTSMLREAILESYLKTIGYTRWQWDDQDPLSISLQVRCYLSLSRVSNRNTTNHLGFERLHAWRVDTYPRICACGSDACAFTHNPPQPPRSLAGRDCPLSYFLGACIFTCNTPLACAG